MNVFGGATSVTTYFSLRLTASGLEATGLTITDIDLQYTRSGEAPAAKVDATALAATSSAWAANKAIEINSTSSKGLYRVDWPDAAFAAGVREVVLSVTCANCFTEHLRVSIDAIADEVQNRFGTGSYVSDTGPIDANVVTINSQTVTASGGITFPAATLASTTNITAGTIATVTNQLTAAQIATGVWQDATAGDFTVSSSIGKSLFTSGAVPGAAGGLFIAGSNAATTVNITGNITGTVATVTTLTNLPAITSNWLTAAGTAADFSTEVVAAMLVTAVPTSNTAQTVGDCLNAARAQGFGKWTIVGTTLTLYANDGSTAVKTFTLDSATVPTSRT